MSYPETTGIPPRRQTKTFSHAGKVRFIERDVAVQALEIILSSPVKFVI
jgi:hypothetical protein